MGNVSLSLVVTSRHVKKLTRLGAISYLIRKVSALNTLPFITERGVHVFDSPGSSADLTPIKATWNIMKKKSVTLPNNKKNAL